MTNEQLTRLLNTACEIITDLEISLMDSMDTEMESRIDALFNEIKYSDDLDSQSEPEYDSAGFSADDRIVNGQYMVPKDADAEAQDPTVFGDRKI